MRVDRADEYEAPALAWLLREAKRLNGCLVQGGVAGIEQRRDIVTSFVFGLASAMGEPIEARGERYVVEVALVKGDDSVLLPTDLFDFHEYAVSIADEVYGLA